MFRIITLAVCILAATLFGSTAMGSTITLTQGVNGYTGVSQAEITAGAWGVYGNTTPAFLNGPGGERLQLYRAWSPIYKVRVFLKWDLAGIVPAGYVVTSARLVMTRYYQVDNSDGADPTINVHKALQPWAEGAVTWMNWSDGGRTMDPANTPYGVLEDPNPSYVGGIMGTISNAGLDEGQYTVDLDASLVNGWITNPSSNYGMFLKYAVDDSVDHTYSHWWGKNAATTANRPTLEITYEEDPANSISLVQGVNGYTGMSQGEIRGYIWGGPGYTYPAYYSPPAATSLFLYRSWTPGYKVRGFLKWDLAGVVPTGHVVTGARLVMTRGWQADLSGGANPTINLHRALQPWTEWDGVAGHDGVTWTNWSEGGRTMDPDNPPYGVLEDPNPAYVGQVMGTIPNTGADAEQYNIEIDPSMIRDWINDPSSNYGMFVKYALDDQVHHTYSIWWGKNCETVAFRPKLVITHQQAPLQSASLIQGVDGYTGVSQAEICGYIWGGPGYTEPSYLMGRGGEKIQLWRSWYPGYKVRGFLKWDLTGVVPDGYSVTNAQLVMTRDYQTDLSGGANPTINIHRALQPWQEWSGQFMDFNGVTWMNWSDGGRVMDPDNTPYGVLQDPNPAYVGQIMGTISNTGLAEAQYTLNLDTSVVNDWINDPSSNLGMFLKYAVDDSVDSTYSFWWAKNAWIPLHRPRLNITFAETPILDVSCAEAKSQPDGTGVRVTAYVSAKFGSYFYIEVAERSSGIRVAAADTGLALGDEVEVVGTMDTLDSGERVIADATPEKTVNPAFVIKPLGMTNKTLGGGDADGQFGVENGVGLNNIGLLVKTTGLVSDVDSVARTFSIDDGSGVGLTATMPSGTLPGNDSYISITGISSCADGGAGIERLVIVTAWE